MDNIEIKNAIIKSVTLSKEDHNLLTAYIGLDYGGLAKHLEGALYICQNHSHMVIIKVDMLAILYLDALK